MYKNIILFISFLLVNSIHSQELKTSKEIQGKWRNEDFEIEVKENSLVKKTKKIQRERHSIEFFRNAKNKRAR